MSADIAQLATERLKPQPLALFAEPVDVESAALPPQDYVICTEDRAIPPALQRLMAKRFPAQIHELSAGHSPFYSHTAEVVQILLYETGVGPEETRLQSPRGTGSYDPTPSQNTERETHLHAGHTASSIVPTESAKRYSKQLAAHLGRKAEIRIEPDGERIVLTFGSCLILSRAEAIELRAESDSAEGLERVKHVSGSHLERFGQRDGLVVQWSTTA